MMTNNIRRRPIKVIILFILIAISISGLLCNELKIEVIVDIAIIRLKPDCQSTVVGKVQLGTILMPLGKIKEWYRINLPPNEDGITISGYIHQNFVQEIPKRGVEPVKVEEKKRKIPTPTDVRPPIPKKEKPKIEEEIRPKPIKIKKNWIRIGGQYFIPSEKSFKNLYGEGIALSGEINIKIWKSIGFWLIGNYYSREGNLPFTEEKTKMTLVPFGGGIKLRIQRSVINPYVGMGPVIYIYEEKNPIGKAEGTKIGIIGQAGCYFRIVGGLLADISINYSYCKVKPQNIKADLGGIQAGIGLGFEF